jgi:acetylserotonin N-methyltransferase
MLQLLEKTADGFTNTAAANVYLTQASPQRMLGYASYTDAVLWKMWANFADAIREGSHRWKQTYDLDGPLFSHFFRTPEQAREFLMGMHGYGVISSPVLVNSVDLSSFRTFVDLGGATGHLTIAACRRWSNLRGIVFDLPVAVELANEIIAEAGMTDRVTATVGDFFMDPLPPADLYALGRILHDWTEEKILLLLGKIHTALPSGGAVLIAEKLLEDSKTAPEWSVLQSLNMLVCTEGQERTLGEYAILLERVGFTDVRGIRTSAPTDVVFARKA